MKQLHFDTFEELAFDIDEKFDSLANKYGDVTIIARYNETKEIVRELTCLGYSIADIEFHNPNWNNYDDEYIIFLNFGGIWCSPMKPNGKYITDDSEIIYILDNCSSNVIPYCRGVFVYETEVGKRDYEEQFERVNNYTVNGQPVSKDEFDEFISRFKETDGKPTELNVNFTGRLSPEESDIILKKVKESFREDICNMLNSMHHPQSCLHPLEFFY